MRQLFSFMAISADGFHANPAGTVDWQTFGPEFADYSVEQLDEVDTLVLGRTTYEELAAYWPGDHGTDFDPRIAERMNSRTKLVASTSLESVTWHGSRLVSVEDIAAYKETPGKDMAVLGSSTLVGTLLRAGLVDELRLMVNPVLLGAGAKLFDSAGVVPLELVRVRPFTSGLVLLHYRPAV
jgi:dihydrofolate reductase